MIIDVYPTVYDGHQNAQVLFLEQQLQQVMFVDEPPDNLLRLLPAGRETNLEPSTRPLKQNTTNRYPASLSPHFPLLQPQPEREKQAGKKKPPKTPRYVCEYGKAVISTETSTMTLTRRYHASTK